MQGSQVRILGIDPGLNKTGYAILDAQANGIRLVEAGVIRASDSRSLAARVLEIGVGVREVIAEFQPQMLAMEQVFSHAQFPKTAVLMAHARGAVLFVAAEARLELSHYAARQVKKWLTGSGRADKLQMQQAVMQALGMTKVLEPHDVADAVAIALCHARQQFGPWAARKSA